MAKTLIVFYSLDGNTRFIAQTLASAFDAELQEIKPVKEPPASRAAKYFWGGRQVVLKEEPEILPLEKNWKNYERLIIGTPVWAFSFTPAIRSYLSLNKISGRQIAVFCCSGGTPGKTLANLRQALAGNEIIGELALIEPLRDPEKNRRLAQDWAGKISKFQH